MNCNYYQDKLETYISGNLDYYSEIELKQHLNDCSECSRLLSAMLASEKVIQYEKSVESNPFLVSRIMSEIETYELNRNKYYILPFRLLKPVLITLSVAAAIILGILEGNIDKKPEIVSQIPEELTITNDANLESLLFFTNE
jgi:predicted anti-sigma-YlaC factor YlaD